MVMRPATAPRSRLPRLRFHPLCLIGRHKPDYYRLSAPGERWATFIFTCLRCNRVIGDSHAARADKPVIGKLAVIKKKKR
jgi:hypothetical protein